MNQGTRAWVGLGANLGEPAQALLAALRAIDALPSTNLAAVSSPWRSAPVDAQGPDYLNAVAALDTQLDPEALLDALLAIEHEAGRARPYRNAPRVLDLDLLMVDDLRLQTTRLTLPHPRMHVRAFVLAPLAELAPTLAVPGHGSVQALLSAILDQPLERLAPPPDWPALRADLEGTPPMSTSG